MALIIPEGNVTLAIGDVFIMTDEIGGVGLTMLWEHHNVLVGFTKYGNANVSLEGGDVVKMRNNVWVSTGKERRDFVVLCTLSDAAPDGNQYFSVAYNDTSSTAAVDMATAILKSYDKYDDII